MKDFVFRLDRVLELRKNQERKALEALGRARRAIHEAQEFHEFLCQSRIPLGRAWREMICCGEVDAATLRDFAAYCGVLEQRIAAAKHLVQKVVALERIELAAVEKARRKRRVLEELRARHELRHQALVLSAEQQVLDEAGAQGRERRRAGGEGDRE